ncbi:MAG: thiamine pyrophosphate-binding protein [bacterium]
MTTYYTDEKNAQIIIALLKKFGIKKVVASPGTTNMALVVSMQNDSFFEMYSSVDERSAAYIACGLAAESEEPVVISCTGATASRNYLSGLTEAYYRKLPILAITSIHDIPKVGHHIPQLLDRSSIQHDVAKLSVTLPIIKDEEDFWDCEIKVNKAINELWRNGGGPVHINLPTKVSRIFNIKTLPDVRKIKCISTVSDFPEIPTGKVALFIGSHTQFSNELTEAVDSFCASHNAVAFCDHTSNYYGKYRVQFSLVACQNMFDGSAIKPDVLIHIGEISGDYYSLGISGNEVWRVSEDGEIRDTFKKLRYVFEMPEKLFFARYTQKDTAASDSYLQECTKKIKEIRNKIPELPFSNMWIASQTAHKIPPNSTIHFGILNSLRSWNFFELPQTVTSASNVGGFGIDGGLSSLIGASFANPHKLYFSVIGDLAFFYDMNVLGNRHVGRNVRILLVNNGKGVEFRNYSHAAAQFDDKADDFIAAAGHFGNKSKTLIKHYAQDLGFEYLVASTKEEFSKASERFVTSDITEKPIIFEVFTESVDECDALKMIKDIEENVKGKAKQFAKHILGDKGIQTIKKIVK